MRANGPVPRAMSPPADPPRVLADLEATRREMRRFRRRLGLARLARAEVALAAVLMGADWMWVLPTAVRALSLLAMVALAVVGVVRLIVGPGDRFGRQEAAAEVEEHFPALGQRVRTTLEYAEPAPTTAPAAPGLVGALARDTDRRTARLDFRGLIPWATLERWAVGLALVGLAGLVTLGVSPGLRTAALRLLLLPVHYTTLHVEPGNQTIKAGSDFTLTATLSGRPVASASWMVRRAGTDGPWTSASLAPATEPGLPPRPLIGTLTAGLKDCQADLDYRVAAGEVQSPTYRLTVIHPLELKALEAVITPPAYTRRPPSVVKQGNFSAIEGSRVRFTITLDRAPATAVLAFRSPGDTERADLPLQIQGAKLTGELPPLAKDLRYEIAATAADGMKLDAGLFQIKVQPDQKPTIRFVRPEESLAVTPTTEVPVEVEAGDDFGVARLGIAYKVGDGPEETLSREDLRDQPPTAEALATMYLEKHTLSHTDGMTYYAFVEDNYPFKPHRVVSELRFIDILPYKQAYQLVDGGGT